MHYNITCTYEAVIWIILKHVYLSFIFNKLALPETDGPSLYIPWLCCVKILILWLFFPFLDIAYFSVDLNLQRLYKVIINIIFKSSATLINILT